MSNVSGNELRSEYFLTKHFLLQVELLSDFEREKQDTFAITADMTRQYKAMQVIFFLHCTLFFYPGSYGFYMNVNIRYFKFMTTD